MLLNGAAQIEETAAPFSNMCSTQADNSSRKLWLCFGCQFPWCALGLLISPQFGLVSVTHLHF
jgi:hypothetical protein